MLFQLGLFKKKASLKNLKILVVSLLLIGGTVLLLSLLGPEFMRHSFISGLGTGMVSGAMGLIVVYMIKRKKEDYQEDLEASLNDERVIQQRLKIIAISHIVLIASLLVMVSISVFNEFSFNVGGTILLIIYIFSLIVVRYFVCKKN